MRREGLRLIPKASGEGCVLPHFRQAILHLTAERICHGALSFRASTFGRGSFLFMIAKLPELVRPPDDRARHRGGC